jgi:3-phenylpropionate/trans-cinnamate dioxygenase ferredoxin reductase subunit
VTRRTFVVLGGGLASATAAATLRNEGFDGRLVLIGAERLPPYERPPLSKGYLRGEQTAERIVVRPEKWFAEQEIETRFGETASALDLGAGTVALAESDPIRFDALLIATGSRARRPAIPGSDLPGVLDLRTLGDADAIRAIAEPGARAVLVGMGFIGAELAASLRSLGVEVTAIEHGKVPLRRAAGPEVGRVIEGLHRDHGVRMHLGRSVEGFEGAGRLEAVRLDEDERVEADFAVVGVGAVPNAEVGAELGLGVDRGILADAELRTIDPRIFVAGDVASHDHPVFGRIRVEHYDNALRSGEAAAKNLLGARAAFEDVHWFWSDQYDVNLQMAGIPTGYDEFVVRGSLEDRAFAAFYLRDGVMVASVSINRPRDVRRSMRMIAARVRPERSQLEDPEFDLRTLVAKRRDRG